MTKQDVDKKAERKAYLERKEKLFKVEENNFEHVIFMRGTEGFYSVFGHSAVFLVNKIAPELKLRVGLKRDTDYGIKFPEGVVNLKNVGYYKARMEESSFLDFERENEDFVFFKLKKKVTDAEFDLLYRSKEIRKQKLEALINKSVPLPKVSMRMTETLKLTFRLYTKHSDALGRKFVVDKLTDSIRVAHKTLLLVGRGEINAKEGLKKIKVQLASSLCDIVQISELGLWPIGDCMSLATMITETLIELEREAKGIDKLLEREEMRKTRLAAARKISE